MVLRVVNERMLNGRARVLSSPRGCIKMQRVIRAVLQRQGWTDAAIARSPGPIDPVSTPFVVLAKLSTGRL